VVRLLFLDDDRSRHAAWRRRAGKLLAGRRHQIFQTTDPRKAIEIMWRLGPRLDAVFLDRDLGRPLTGEDVAFAMTRLPAGARPRKVMVHSRNFWRAPAMVNMLRASGYHVLRRPFEL
jgi:hypothetical protein